MRETVPEKPAGSIKRVIWQREGGTGQKVERLCDLEWLVTNGLGGYASSSVCNISTRKYHGLLVAAVPSPLGRMVMLSKIKKEVILPDGTEVEILSESRPGEVCYAGCEQLLEFSLDYGLPVWRYRINDFVIEKRILLPHFQNTVYIDYRLISGAGPIQLRLRPFMRFRSLKEEMSDSPEEAYGVHASGERFEIVKSPDLPVLRLYLYGSERSLNLVAEHSSEYYYRTEQRRGYPDKEKLWSPGFFLTMLSTEKNATMVASTEPWDIALSLEPEEAFRSERERRQRLISVAMPEAQQGPAAELVLTADQFIVAPMTRVTDAIRARARGDELRSIVAGYHWFTDWGRDTMISLEGLTMLTGRLTEAGYILRTFAHYVNHGLIPNMFPEGAMAARYNTADATLWFFHAMQRYIEISRDYATLDQHFPMFEEILQYHIQGTRFGIGMDHSDGLLRQGEEGLALTWMDAKVDDWVVTPRRGKTVEINALWYNALRTYQGWIEMTGREDRHSVSQLAEKVHQSFNERFWYDSGGYLYDLVDGEKGDDSSLRPNQLFSISLGHPVLDPSHWKSVVSVVKERLLTPVGIRSLDPRHPDYKVQYKGNLWARDAAYHQGTVWSWLIGPFVDAWLRVYPDDLVTARGFLQGLIKHLDEACVGSVSEVFDGDPPFLPEGCVSQAWSVAELLRCLIRTEGKSDEPQGPDGLA